MTLLALLPSSGLFAWALVLRRRQSRSTRDWLEAAADAATLGVVWLVLGTELLGAAHGLSRWSLAVWWGIPLAAAAWLLARGRNDRELAFESPRRWTFRETRVPWSALPLVALLVWSALQAWLAAPNTLDALAYHLPRQVHWAQQGDLSHYPTSVLRQLTMPPLAEYAGLHLLLLSGGDRFHGLVQWCAFAGTLAVIGGIVRSLGGRRSAQLLAIAFFATAPPAFVQASNCKNDLVVGLWFALATRELILLAQGRHDARRPWRLAVQLGALALTKGTALAFGLPLLVASAFVLRRCRALLPGAAVLLLGAAMLNAPYLARNLGAFGSPWGSAEVHGGAFTPALHTPAALVSTALRNAAAQLALPWPAWNRGLGQLVTTSHGLLGLSPDDPRTTHRLPPYVLPLFSPAWEDLAIAPVQFAVALLFPLLLATRRDGRRRLFWLWAAAASGFLLFSFTVQWSLWNVRYFSPLFVPLAAAFGLALEHASPLLRAGAALVLGALLVPWLNTAERPLLGRKSLLVSAREDSRYAGVGEHAPRLRALLDVCAREKPRSVGVMTGWNGLEYLYAAGLADRLGAMPAFSSFNSRFIPAGVPEPTPDVALVESTSLARWLPGGRMRQDATGAIYVAVAYSDAVALCVRDRGPALVAQADLVLLGSIEGCSSSGPTMRCRLKPITFLAGSEPGPVEIVALDPKRLPPGRAYQPTLVADEPGIWALRRIAPHEYELPSPLFWRAQGERGEVEAVLRHAAE